MLREPLLHFAVLGLALFALWGAVGGGDDPLIVSAATVQRLRTDAERRLGHPPDDAELQAVIDAHVDDELLYREGLALGLDRADPVVRRRVVQKMRFLHEDLRPIPEPTAADLAALALDAAVPAQVAFEHVQLRVDGRDAAAVDAEVADVLAQLAAGADPASLGEPSVLGRSFTARALPVIERDFGSGFAAALADAPVGRWVRADSPYGAHVVRVIGREEGRPARPDEVQAGAVDAWKRARRRQNAIDALAALRARADVRVER